MNSQLRQAFDWRLSASLFAVVALWATPLVAVPINHGTFGPDPPGVTMYLDVTESSGTDPIPPGRYGEPTLNGNTLDFNPTEFVATASGGDLDITDVQLNYTLMTTPLAGATSMLISEAGDFTLFGAGTELTAVVAALGVQIDILAVDSIPLLNPISIDFPSTSFTANYADDGEALAEPWNNSFLVDFEVILNDHEVPYELGVSKVNVVINNQLIASSEAASLAFIAKKDFTISTQVEIVPEPASWAMMALAVAGFGLAAYRRRVARSTRQRRA